MIPFCVKEIGKKGTQVLRYQYIRAHNSTQNSRNKNPPSLEIDLYLFKTMNFTWFKTNDLIVNRQIKLVNIDNRDQNMFGIFRT